MENDPLTIEEQENFVLDHFVKQRANLTKQIAKPMNKRSLKNNAIAYSVGGVLLGLMSGIILTDTNSDVAVRDQSGHVIEYKTDYQKATKTMLATLAGSILIALGLFGLTSASDAKDNHHLAEKLSIDVFKKTFTKALEKYVAPKEYSFSVLQATALILNNMAPYEIHELRKLLASGLTYNKTEGLYTITPDAQEKATKLISDFISVNLDLFGNIRRIMNGERYPRTYYINNITHIKTR